MTQIFLGPLKEAANVTGTVTFTSLPLGSTLTSAAETVHLLFETLLADPIATAEKNPLPSSFLAATVLPPLMSTQQAVCPAPGSTSLIKSCTSLTIEAPPGCETES